MSQRVWRNSEGREFPDDGHGNAVFSGSMLPLAPFYMRELGYELVEGEIQDSAEQVGAPSGNDESKRLWQSVLEQDAEFERELASLVNRRSLENVSNTPDFLLGRYMRWALDMLNVIIGERDRWYGIAPSPGAPSEIDESVRLREAQRKAWAEGVQAKAENKWGIPLSNPYDPPNEADPEEFEVECSTIGGWLGTRDETPLMNDPRLIPGKTYLVREKP